MKTLTPTTLTLLTTLVTLIPACETADFDPELDAELEPELDAELDPELDVEFEPELGPEPTHTDPAESELGLLEPAQDEALATLTCDVDDQAAVGGLYYPGWTCANAIAHAETTLGGYHYRNACNQQVGSDISLPASEADVSSCTIQSGSAVVSVDLCCEPPPGLSCDVDEQASVGGLHYPGWTCADATAHAEATLAGYHYRNACNQQVGSAISSPADEALVTSCTIQSGSAVVSVDLCCEPPVAVPAIPQGTWKFCIAAGTQQQMLASCEAGGQTWGSWFANGTYSTQQYINMWGNPCPVGTSLIPNSQFYVANSCNPLPNVGAGCGGPGSFNYEYKIGVMCQ